MMEKGLLSPQQVAESPLLLVEKELVPTRSWPLARPKKKRRRRVKNLWDCRVIGSSSRRRQASQAIAEAGRRGDAGGRRQQEEATELPERPSISIFISIQFSDTTI